MLISEKYEFTTETKEIDGVIVKRIRSVVNFGDVEAGDLGGFIEKESNLPDESDDTSWIGENVVVMGSSRVHNGSTIEGSVKIIDSDITDSHIEGVVSVRGSKIVNSQLYGIPSNSGTKAYKTNGINIVSCEVTECDIGGIHHLENGDVNGVRITDI